MGKIIAEGTHYVIQGTKTVRNKCLGRKGTMAQYVMCYQFTAPNDDEAKKILTSFTRTVGNQSDKTQIRYNIKLFKVTTTELS